MVALTMVAPWVASDVTFVGLALAGLLLAVIQADRPSAKRLMVAALVVAVFVGSCVLFAEEVVFQTPCATDECRESWACWVAHSCWMFGIW